MSKRVSVSYFFLVLYIVVACNFFKLLPTSKYIYDADFVNVMLIIVFVISIIAIGYKKKIKLYYLGKYQYWLIFSLMVWIIEVLYSTYRYYIYGQNIIQVISASFSELTVIILIPLSVFQESSKDINALKNIIKKLGVVASILSILQVFLFKYNIIFLDIDNSVTRYGSLRFCVGAVVIQFSFILYFFNLLSEKKKKDFVYLILIGISLVYAAKTRMVIIYLVFSIIITVTLFLKNKTMKVIILVIIGIGIITFYVTGFMSSLITELDSDDGVNMRFNAINYYWKQFCEHPFLGMGYIKASTSSPYLQEILYGPLWYGTIRYYYRDDVGIVGFLNGKGLLGLTWYMSLLYFLYKQIKCIYKRNPRKYTWMLAIFIYIVICSINIMFSDPQKIPFLLIFVSLVQHYYYNETTKSSL